MKGEVKVEFFGVSTCPRCGQLMSDDLRICDECSAEIADEY